MKLHFDVFDEFLAENLIEKKRILSGLIKVFFCDKGFFPIWAIIKAKKKTFITKKKHLSQYFAQIRTKFGLFWHKKRYIKKWRLEVSNRFFVIFDKKLTLRSKSDFCSKNRNFTFSTNIKMDTGGQQLIFGQKKPKVQIFDEN